ncbi:MAG: DUF2169 domain-containing protein, partial [Arenicella sp.]|nr:DUF2169 domain-containing protein [Arenicella sp.]
MQIIKPTLLSLLHRPLLQAGKYHLVVSPLLWFSLSNAEEIVPEQEGWKRMMASLATGETFDVGTPKSNAEALVSGRAYPPVDQRLTSMQVGFEIEGKVSKYVDVHGDQYWVKTNNGWKLSATEPLNALEMTWGNSFGGDGFVDNPLGKGFYDTDKINQIDHIAVPNIRSKNEIYDRLNNNHRPIGFGPIDIMRPVRQKRAGTYDEQWLEQGYPGLAADHDPAIYNVAQTDQWAESYFCGDENYEIHGMSSTEAVLKGKLPAMKCRAFIQTSSGKTNELQEVSTHIDTVWFFPEQDIGLIISRGTVEIEDSDGLDVQLLMTAFERMGDEPRTIKHYQNVHRLRTDPETAVAQLMNESQLVPNKTAEQVQRYQTEIENARKVRKDRIKKHLDDIEANHNVDSSGTKALSLPAQDVDILDLDSLPIISPEAIARGDIDLTDAIAGLKKMADDCKSEGDKALTQLDQVDHSNASLKSTKAAQSLAQLEGQLSARFEPI